jgi:hypothetical protein
MKLFPVIYIRLINFIHILPYFSVLKLQPAQCSRVYNRICLKCEIFEQFANERWLNRLNRYQVSSADGCILTKSIVKRGWKTYMQKRLILRLLTMAKDDGTWLLQVIRWSRDNKRQNIKALVFNL